MKLNRVLTIAAAACVLWLQPGAASAQPARHTSPMIPVAVVLTPAGTSDQTEIMITRVARDGYRIILPGSVATPENLRTAIRTVSRLLDQDGDGHRDNRVFRVEPGQSYTLGESPGAQRVIDELMKMAGDGRGSSQSPSMTIYLPAAQERAARRGSRPGLR